MNVISFVFVCILFFIQTSVFGVSFLNSKYVEPEYINMADPIRAKVAEQLSKRHNMHVVGTRSGMVKCVNMIGLSFQINGPITKDILRKILVDSVEEFLNQINADEKLRPFLKNYPFTEKEIEIVIFIKNENGIKIYDPDIAVASAKNGNINFMTVDKNKSTGPYKQTIKEDYQYDKEIVQKESLKY